MESLIPELQDLVLKIASENNLTNYTVEVSNSVASEGDGYIGILNGFSLIDKDSDKKLSLVIKKAPTNEALRKQFPTRMCFLKEICMYTKIFPEIQKFQEEYNIPNPFEAITNLYGYISDEFKETLILKNLKEDGYRLCKRQEPLDSHHLSLVITEYARLHAVSHAMRKLQPEKFEKMKQLIGRHPMVEFTTHIEPNQDGQGDSSSPDAPKVNMNLEAMADHLFAATLETVKNKPKALKALQACKTNLMAFALEKAHKPDEHSVISHGDCWSTNLLFKYEDKNAPKIPTKLCLIDWQMGQVSSPIHDISYFFYISAAKKDLQNYMRYLHIYHTALSEALTSFGLDPEEVYSFEMLEEEWNKKSKLGFQMTLVMMQQTLSEGKTHDFEELAKEGKQLFDASLKKVEVSDLFKERMGDLVEFLVDNNFI